MQNCDHIGREIETTALGRTWRVSRWDRRVWVEFADWARTMLPDPIEALAKSIDKIALKDAEILREILRKDQEEQARYEAALALCKTPEDTARVPRPILLAGKYIQQSDVMGRRALDKASSYLSFNSPEMNSLIGSVVGSGHLMYLLLKKHHPDVDEDTAFDVSTQLSHRLTYVDSSGEQSSELEHILAVVQGRLAPLPKNPVAPPAS